MTDLVQLGFTANTRGLVTAQTQLDKTTAAGGRLDKQMTATQKALGAVGTLIAAIGVTASTGQIIKYTDSWSNLNTQLKQVTDTEKELLSVREQLLKISKETRIDLSATVGLYAEMTRGVADLNVSSDKLLGITKTLNNLFLVGGKPLSEMTGAIRQLNQGFASGVLRGDEFNSVAEGAPRIMDALTASLGKTRGELRDFAATGGITAEIMVKALADYEDTAQRLADTVEMTFGQSMEVASTNMMEFIGESEGINSAIDSLGDGLVHLSENLAPISVALGGAAGLVSLLAASKAATVALSASMSALNAVMMANPIGIVVGSIAALGGALFAARNMTIEYGDETIKVMDSIEAGFKLVDDGFDSVIQLSNFAYTAIMDLFKGIADGSSFAAESIGNDFIDSFGNIYDFAKRGVNGMIATFVSLGKAIGIVAAAIVTSFSNSFANIKNMSEAVWKDIKAALSGNFSGENLTKAMQSGLSVSFSSVVNEISEEAKKAFDTDFIGGAAEALGGTVSELTSKFDDYVISIRNARLESEKMASEQAELDAALDRIFGSSGTSSSATKTMSEDLKDLIDEVDDFGGAWTRTGNAIVDSMGDAVSVLDDFASRMGAISRLQAELSKERENYTDGTKEAIKIDQSLAKLQAESSSAQLSAIGQTIGLSTQLFEENSKERKALHSLEMGFMAAEIALAAEKAIVSAVGAVATQGGGDPYTAFGRIAAMIAIMGGVLGAAGIAFGAGSGSSYSVPDQAGTGTVLGDSSAQSASIENAFDYFEDIQVDQLAELQTISAAMTGLSSGIEQLASQFVQGLDFTGATRSDLGTTGRLDTGGLFEKIGDAAISPISGPIGQLIDGIVGSFKKTKVELVDSGISFASQSIVDAIANGLSADVYNALEKTKSSWWGLVKDSSTEIEFTELDSSISQQMGNIFGYIGDSVMGAIDVLGIDTADNLEDFTISLGDVSFLDKTGEEIQAELEAMFSQQSDLIAQYLAPSISQYQKVGEGAFETLQRVAYEQAIFNDALEMTNMSLIRLSSSLQVDMAQSIITLVGGIEAFSELSNTFFESFYSEAEQLTQLEGSIRDVFNSLDMGMVNTREGFRALVESLDRTNESDQALYATLLQLSPAMDEYISQLEELASDKLSLQIKLLEEQGFASEALALSRQQELDAMNESLRPLQELIWRQQELNEARDAELDSLAELKTTLENNVAFAENQLDDARDAEIQMYDELISAAQDSATAQISSINEIATARVSALNSERSIIESIANQLGEASKSVSATAALSAARGGDFSLAGSIEAGTYTDAESAKIGAAREAFALAEIGKLADAQLSDIDKSIAAVESSATSQINAVNRASAAEIAELESQKDALNTQVDSLLNIDNSVLSVTEAINMLASERQELAALDYENQRAQIEAQYATISAIESAAVTIANTDKSYDNLVTDNKRIIDELKALRKEQEVANAQIATNTSKTAANTRTTNDLVS